MTLTVLRSVGQIFIRISLYWNLSDVFLKIRLGLWGFFERKTTEVKCHFHLIVSRVISVVVDLDHLAEVMFVKFVHIKLVLHPTHSIL